MESATGNLDAGGRIVPAGNGWQWIADGWKLFMKQPGVWVLITVIVAVVFAVLAWIPFIGTLALALVGPILGGSLMVGTQACDRSGTLEPAHLLVGFKEKTGKLVTVGIFNLIASFVLIVLVGLIAGAGAGMGALMGGMAGGGGGAMMGGMAGMTMSMMFGGLVALALSVPIAAALWFAPALIMFRDAEPMDALKMSFFGCLRNIVPFVVYGIVAFVLAIVASIPFGLGWLALGPVLAASIYTAYRDIFGA